MTLGICRRRRHITGEFFSIYIISLIISLGSLVGFFGFFGCGWWYIHGDGGWLGCSTSLGGGVVRFAFLSSFFCFRMYLSNWLWRGAYGAYTPIDRQHLYASWSVWAAYMTSKGRVSCGGCTVDQPVIWCLMLYCCYNLPIELKEEKKGKKTLGDGFTPQPCPGPSSLAWKLKSLPSFLPSK